LNNYVRLPASSYSVITPTKDLRNDWERKLTQRGDDTVKTFERALVEGLASIVILDDFGKLPPGYTDLLLALHSDIRLIVATGDHKQSIHHSSNREARTFSMQPEIDVWSRYSDYYLNITHRCPLRIANALGIYSCSSTIGSVLTAHRPEVGELVLAPGLDTADSLSRLGHNVCTYAGS
jgi:hypothetical protein